MRAELFLTNYRPVPLTEYAVFKGCVYAKVNSCFYLPCMPNVDTTSYATRPAATVAITSAHPC